MEFLQIVLSLGGCGWINLSLSQFLNLQNISCFSVSLGYDEGATHYSCALQKNAKRTTTFLVASLLHHAVASIVHESTKLYSYQVL